jgi:hypothetical protein
MQFYDVAQARMKLVARIFAETGIADMFWLLHRTIRKNGDQQMTLRLRNKWVTVDPRNWKDRNDMTVNVGLGHGGKAEQMQQMLVLINAQREAAAGMMGMVKPINFYNSARDLVRLLDKKDVDRYFTQPDPNAQMPTPPDPNQGKAAIEQAKAQAKAQTDQAQLAAKTQSEQMKAQIEAQKTAMDVQVKQMEAAHKTAIEKLQAEADIAVGRAKAAAQMQIAEQKHALEVDKATIQAQLDVHKHILDAHFAQQKHQIDMTAKQQDAANKREDFKQRASERRAAARSRPKGKSDGGR